MGNFFLDRAIEVLEETLGDIDHWDGRDLDRDALEKIIAGIEWDVKYTLDILKELKGKL